MNTTPLTAASSEATAELLLAREAELRALLDNGAAAGAADASAEVTDFKDAAAEEADAEVRDAQAGHAAHELEQVQAALRRLQGGSYGQCVECGAAIDPRRLQALPATPCCTACQTAQEQQLRGAAR